MARRHGRTQRGILLHLMLATLRPTLEGIDYLLREGALYPEQHHMFLRVDAAADPCSVDFWETACTLCTSGGLQLVPRCLLSIARRVASAGKAVAVLHEHERMNAALPATALDVSQDSDLMRECAPVFNLIAKPLLRPACCRQAPLCVCVHCSSNPGCVLLVAGKHACACASEHRWTGNVSVDTWPVEAHFDNGCLCAKRLTQATDALLRTH